MIHNRIGRVIRVVSAFAGAALVPLGCNGCNGGTSEAQPPTVAVPSATGSSALAASDPAQERATGGCVIGGCSGELCQPPNMPEMATTCMYKPEWDCYKEAQCGRNAENQCEWEMTPELEKCLSVAAKRGGGDIH